MSDNNDNDKNPLVEISDLAGLSKPATVLVSRVLDGFGAVGKLAISIPQAKVDAKVARIKAKTALDIADMQSRAAFRVEREKIWEQKNLESIVAKAVREIHDKNIAPEEMDEDWISQFNDKAKRVSKDDMQGLWAKILAGEAKAPGSFSPKTLEIVSVLNKADAELFAKLCSFVVTVHIVKLPFISDVGVPIYEKNGINYRTLQHMHSLGLITYTPSIVNILSEILPGRDIPTSFTVAGKGFSFIAKAEQNVFKQGKVLFTNSGEELSHICQSDIVSDFSLYVMEEYERYGVKCFPASPLN